MPLLRQIFQTTSVQESRLVDLPRKFCYDISSRRGSKFLPKGSLRIIYTANICRRPPWSWYFPPSIAALSRSKMPLESNAPPWFNRSAFSTCRWCDDINITLLASNGIKMFHHFLIEVGWPTEKSAILRMKNCIAQQHNRRLSLEKISWKNLLFVDPRYNRYRPDPPWLNDPWWHWWRLPPHWVLLDWSYHIPMPKWAT